MTASVSPGAIVNQKPRPRLLLHGVDSTFATSLEALVPTYLSVASPTAVRQAEWDILITTQPMLVSSGTYRNLIEPHILVIYLMDPEDAPPFGQAIEFSPNTFITRTHGGNISSELRRQRGLPPEIADLCHEQLEPLLVSEREHPFFEMEKVNNRNQIPTIEPFIESADGKFLAGRYKRSPSSETWILRKDLPDLAAWFRAALKEWQKIAPDRIPGLPNWSHADKWSSHAEVEIRRQLSDLGAEREQVLIQISDRERKLLDTLEEARAEADTYERALLTGQNDVLKEAVARALRDLGFNVIDQDELQPPDDHVEDLRVFDPAFPGWIALAEVKGYSKGAKTEAMTQFLRFQARYMQETGQSPNALWYVVNQFINRDPDNRQPVLHGSPGDVSTFAAANGLILDTVAVFNLLNQVREGTISQEAARERLRNTSGRFVL